MATQGIKSGWDHGRFKFALHGQEVGVLVNAPFHLGHRARLCPASNGDGAQWAKPHSLGFFHTVHYIVGRPNLVAARQIA